MHVELVRIRSRRFVPGLHERVVARLSEDAGCARRLFARAED